MERKARLILCSWRIIFLCCISVAFALDGWGEECRHL